MPRPRIYEEPRKATAVRLPVSLLEELKNAALRRDVSVNYLVIRAVSDYLGAAPVETTPPARAFRAAPSAP